MSDIFISYAKEDRPHAERLAHALEGEGWSVWWDIIIPAGLTFDEVIEEALDAARCVIVIWTERSVRRRWVRTEAEEAVKRNILVPVRIEEVDPPLAFRRFQARNLIGWDGTAKATEFRRLVTDVERLLGPSPRQEEAKRDAEEQARKQQEAEVAEAERAQEERRAKERKKEEERKQAEAAEASWKAEEADRKRPVQAPKPLVGQPAAEPSQPPADQTKKTHPAEINWLKWGAGAALMVVAGVAIWVALGSRKEPVITFRASTESVALGDSVTLFWEVDHADGGVVLEPGIGEVAPDDSLTLAPESTTVFVLTAAGEGGQQADSIPIHVINTALAPSANLLAQRDSVQRGSSVTLSWSTSNADSVTLTPGPGSVNTSGNIRVTPQRDTWYRLHAVSRGGEAADSVQIRVTEAPPPPLPVVSLTADATSIERGSAVLLSWSTRNATTVSIEPGLGTVPASGNRSMSPRDNVTYRLEARGSGGTTRASLVVTVVDRPLRAGDELPNDCDACPVMVYIPAGEFTMGSPDTEPGRRRQSDEGPQRRVTVAAFAMGRYEVTRGEYQVFGRATGRAWSPPSYSQTDDHPVVDLRWKDAKAYVDWLSQISGQPYRLPSEAEWEYAARADSTTPWHWGASAAECSTYANGSGSCGDEYTTTAPVGSFLPNGYGLHDMAGNVWEWVADCYHASYSEAPEDGSAWTSGDCTYRALRGGSWSSVPAYLRSAYRGWGLPTFPYLGSGFRVARTITR